MATWNDFAEQAPELAAQIRARLDAHTHKTLATLRKDGGPRISGTETEIIDGDLWIGSMWQALKAHDLQRDARYALHSGSIDPPDWDGDAKLAGRAEEITDPDTVARINGPKAPPGPSHLFRLDISEASFVELGEDGASIALHVWTEADGLRPVLRRA